MTDAERQCAIRERVDALLRELRATAESDPGLGDSESENRG